METEFTLTEESVRDIVQAEVQRLSSQKGPQNSRGRSRRRGTQTPNDVNNSQRRGRSSSKGKNNRKRSQSTSRKPKRRGQSSTNNRRVSLPKKRRRQRYRPRNVDCRTAYQKWLFSMAKRPLYDLLPRNSEIHNFTSVHLTDRQKRIIGLGLKFRPKQKPPDLTQFNVQIQDFCRSVR